MTEIRFNGALSSDEIKIWNSTLTEFRIINAEDFFKNKNQALSQHDVIKNEVAVCVHDNIDVILPIRRCLKCQHIEEWKPKQTVL